MLPLAEATGRCEIRPDSYVARIETIADGPGTRGAYFDAQKRLQLQRARAVVLCANGAETPRLLLNSASSRFPHGLANSSGVVGKHLMFNTYFGVERAVRAAAERVQERAEHPDGAWISTTPIRSAGSTAAAAIDARFGKYPITFALGGLPPGAPTWGEGFARELAEQFTRTMFFGAHGTSLPLERNSVSIDPGAEGCLGPAVHAGHLQGSSRTISRTRSFSPRAPCEIAQAAGALQGVARADPAADAVGAPARHLPHGQRSADLGGRPLSTAPTMCRTCSSATAAAWSPRRAGSRPRRSRRWRSGPASTSRPSPSAARSRLGFPISDLAISDFAVDFR